jgi:exosortase
MMKPDVPCSWLPLAGAVALWVPPMVAASHVWSHGQYYDYGWFVPPAAIWLMILRWRDLGGPMRFPPGRMVLGLVALLLPWFLALRVLGNTDPSWRLPMILSGMTSAVAVHWLIAVTRGWRASSGFAWITLFWVSALPWPSVVETGIVHHLTRWVVAVVAETFQIMGKPVEVFGDHLGFHEVTVEVTDGCSGVRSFQSFVMATWFFAELQRLRVGGAMSLLAMACGVAFLVNAARTYALAWIRFTQGEAVFHHAHDWLGLLAFAVSAAAFYYLSGLLAGQSRRTLVKTRQGADERDRMTHR